MTDGRRERVPGRRAGVQTPSGESAPVPGRRTLVEANWAAPAPRASSVARQTLPSAGPATPKASEQDAAFEAAMADARTHLDALEAALAGGDHAHVLDLAEAAEETLAVAHEHAGQGPTATGAYRVGAFLGLRPQHWAGPPVMLGPPLPTR